MSRSYKKYPGCKVSDTWMKKYANRRLRRISVDAEIPDGKAYRRYTDPYNVCDGYFIEFVDTYEEFRQMRIREEISFLTSHFGLLYLRACRHSEIGSDKFEKDLQREWHRLRNK